MGLRQVLIVHWHLSAKQQHRGQLDIHPPPPPPAPPSGLLALIMNPPSRNSIGPLKSTYLDFKTSFCRPVPPLAVEQTTQSYVLCSRLATRDILGHSLTPPNGCRLSSNNSTTAGLEQCVTQLEAYTCSAPYDSYLPTVFGTEHATVMSRHWKLLWFELDLPSSTHLWTMQKLAGCCQSSQKAPFKQCFRCECQSCTNFRNNKARQCKTRISICGLWLCKGLFSRY